jgi:hypothetical protein
MGVVPWTTAPSEHTASQKWTLERDHNDRLIIKSRAVADGDVKVDGDSTFTVKMEDSDFIMKVQTHEIQFGAGPRSARRMIVRETVTDKGDVSRTRTVVEVMEHRPGLQLPPHKQLRMWDAGTGGNDDDS